VPFLLPWPRVVLLIRRILTNAVACRDVAHGQELALRRMLPKRVFFFGHLDKRLDGKSRDSVTRR